MNKRKFVIILVIIIVIGLIVGAFKIGIELKAKRELAELKASVNTELDNYKYNKDLALSYLSVYNIKDETTYQAIKSSLYDKLGSDLQNEIFPTVNYTGLALHDISYTVLEIMGTNNELNSENTFMITYNLKGINYNQDITNLITLLNGKIMSVVRID